MTAIKAPPQYLSAETGNPNRNRCFYFTCPICERFTIGAKHGKEMYKGLQEWKKFIRNAVCKIVMDKGVSVEDAKVWEKKAFDELEEAQLNDKNKAIINPAYTEWAEVNKKTPKTNNTITKILEDNEQLKNELIEMKKKFDELKQQENNDEEVNNWKSRVGRRDETIMELKVVIEELKKTQKQSRKKKEQTEV